ncbi:MAG: polynucleotide kinase-phosphatase, partial [Lachnospiraceae bacterium]|nr:polynucleotide kinase-phosphatase [Lachnospiraceae bacterium]
GRSGLAAATAAIKQAADIQKSKAIPTESETNNDLDLRELLDAYENRATTLKQYTDAYRRYCWDVASLDDYRIAPFHILASEGRMWTEQNHIQQMETIKEYICGSDPIFMATNYLRVDVLDEQSVKKGVDWWLKLTEAGGEGMVVKPYDFIAHNGAELLQPAVKCRGRQYLRIIYGPEYTLGDNLERLKKRSLSKKRNLALNEFALGMEALEHFVHNLPLHRVHECVFGVLAMESEPVDPRL